MAGRRDYYDEGTSAKASPPRLNALFLANIELLGDGGFDCIAEESWLAPWNLDYHGSWRRMLVTRPPISSFCTTMDGYYFTSFPDKRRCTVPVRIKNPTGITMKDLCNGLEKACGKCYRAHHAHYDKFVTAFDGLLNIPVDGEEHQSSRYDLSEEDVGDDEESGDGRGSDDSEASDDLDDSDDDLDIEDSGGDEAESISDD